MPQSRNEDLESKLVEQVYEQLCAPVKTRDDLLRLFVHTLGYTFIDGRIPGEREIFGEGGLDDVKAGCVRPVEKVKEMIPRWASKS
jgi:hypothetical protein